MKNYFYVQARIESKRFPNKVLKKICNKSIIELISERIERLNKIGSIIVVTGEKNKNALLIDEVKKLGLDYFSGNDENILDRFYNASITYQSDNIIRITADNVLFDTKLIEKCYNIFMNNDYDFVSIVKNQFPRGLGFEIFKQKALKTSWLESQKNFKSDIEFKTSFISPCVFMEENKQLKKYIFQNGVKYPKMRLTIDYPEDYEFVKAIYEKLYEKNNDFEFNDVLELINSNPSLLKINEQYNK